ncbi:MAG: hypothetical protein Q9191_004279 [Dirinaria sp. TL-2023a]
MTAINTLVAKSDNIRAAALNLNAKTFEARQTLAGIWDLKPTAIAPPPLESTFQLDMKNSIDESIIGEGDERVKVEEKHFMPGGKYRSIVKIFMHYEFQAPGQWHIGTGWLIRPDVLVTAGHCSYSWNHSLGRATEVKAYIGYQGDASVNSPNTQFRPVKRIVIREGWLKGRGARNFDVSFMQVEKPFTGIKPIVYTETPQSGEYPLGVVGYPADLKDDKTGEKGAYMYEMFLDTKYDLSTQVDTMLEYQIDTFGGNSGSPVLRQPKLDSIGVHVYGGTYNSASVIGRYGNPFNDYIMGFDVQLTNDGLNIIPIQATDAAPFSIDSGSTQQSADHIPRYPGFQTRRGYQQSGFQQSGLPGLSTGLRGPDPISSRSSRLRVPSGGESNEESFVDTMKDALRIGAPLLGDVLKTGLPIALGPVGAPIGALAGLALNAAAKLAESTDAESFDPSEAQEGTMERAILAEAALTAMQKMDLHPDDQESILSDMKDYVVKAVPTIKKVAPHIMGAMMEPALRIALNSLHSYNQQDHSGAEAFEDQSNEPFRLNVTYSNAIDQRGDRNAEAFLQGLTKSMEQGQEAFDGESEAGFYDLITAGVLFANKGLITGARVGLPILAKMVDNSADSIEAGSAAPSALSSNDLAKRALVGEAALQAMMKLPPQVLEEAGIFNMISHAVKNIAPIVVKVAPTVISNLSPALGRIIKAAAGQEAALAGTAAPKLGQRSLSAKRSISSLRRKAGGNDFLTKVQDWHADKGY